MLKWLRGKSPLTEIVTDDPLATINVNRLSDQRPLEIYAVSRVNPLFDDDDGRNGLKSKGKIRDKHKENSPEPTGKSGSSGYESGLYNSSSECSSGASGPTIYSGEVPKTTILRDDAVTVVEQNLGFVKSILVAVRGGSPRGTKSKHSRKPSGSSLVTLSPIPEGKIDYCIPRPVWPPSDDDKHVYVNVLPCARDPIVDDALLLYTRLSYNPLPLLSIPRVGARHTQNGAAKNISQTVDRRDAESESILRDLSNTINQALEGNHTTSHEELLKSLSNKINRNLDTITRSSSSEEALKQFSFTLSQSESLAKMARALSHSSGSSGGSSISVGVRRTLLKGSDYVSVSCKTSPTTSDSEPVVGSSSSSAASSSGFSDCTHTPPSSSTDSPSSQRGRDLSQPPTFVHEDLANMQNSARNALIYGSLCRVSGASDNNTYEKLLDRKQTSDSDESVRKENLGDESLWQTYCGTGVTAGDVQLKSKSDTFYQWSADRPDFTLDMPRSERLMRKINAAKKRRCWCNFFTSLLGLIFFIASVMIVSMFLTRGKRIFGSL